jgi:hypothetical protein
MGLRVMTPEQVKQRRIARAQAYVDAVSNLDPDSLATSWHDIEDDSAHVVRDIVATLDSGFNVAAMRRDIGID